MCKAERTGGGKTQTPIYGAASGKGEVVCCHEGSSRQEDLGERKHLGVIQMPRSRKH